MLALGLCVAAVLFLGLGAIAFLDPDEGRYALVATEMLAHGRWLAPTLDLAPYPDKPAPFFWLVAGCFSLFGKVEWAARLPSVVPAAALVFLVLAWGRKHLGFSSGLSGAFVLSTSGEFVFLSRVVRMDALLTLSVSVALFYAYELWEGAERKDWWVMYAALAAGLLVKGPIALALPAFALATFAASSGGWGRRLRRLRLGRGMTIVAATAGTWYLVLGILHPHYLSSFLLEHNLGRFMSASTGHPEPWYFFILVLPLCFLPWTLLLPACARRSVELARRGSRPHMFLLLWAASSFLLLSISEAKLAPYLLPIFPPLALLSGDAAVWMLRHREAGRRWLRLAAVGWVILCAVLLLFALASLPFVPPWFEKPLAVLFPLFLLSLGASAIALKKKQEKWVVPVMLLSAVAFFPLAALSAGELANSFSLKEAAPWVERLPPETKLYAYKTHGYSLSFYSGKRVTRLLTTAKAAALLGRSRPVAVLLKMRHLLRLAHHLKGPVTVLWMGKAQGKVIVANRRPRRGESLLLFPLPEKGKPATKSPQRGWPELQAGPLAATILLKRSTVNSTALRAQEGGARNIGASGLGVTTQMASSTRDKAAVAALPQVSTELASLST